MESFDWILELALLLLATKCVEIPIARLGIGRVIAYLLVGLCVSALRLFSGYEMSPVIVALSYLGIMLLLFEAGMESSIRAFIKSFRSAGAIALGGAMASLALSYLAMPLLHLDMVGAFALGTALSATSISVTVRTFEELRALDSVECQLIVGAAVVDDVLGLALLSVLTSISAMGIDLVRIGIVSIAALGLWFSTAWIASIVSRRLARLAHTDEAGMEIVALAIILVLAYLATKIGLSIILVAYAFGLGIASARLIARRVGERLRILSLLFSPLFFVYATSRIDLAQVIEVEPVKLLSTLIIVIVLAFASKIIGCGATALALGLGRRSALVVGFGMVPRAEVMIVAATVALELGYITQDVYVSLLMLIPVSCMSIPPIIRRLL